MPFSKQVEDDEILRRFEVCEDEYGRKGFTPDELARELDITGEAVRQRLIKMDGNEVEQIKLSALTLWKKKGEEVFADGGYNIRGFSVGSISIPYLTRGNLGPRERLFAVLNLYLTLFLIFIGLASYTFENLLSIESLALVGLFATIGAFIGLVGELMLIYTPHTEPLESVGKLIQRVMK